MKKILLWSLILIMGSCAVTKDKESGGGEDGVHDDAFIKALGELEILDSDGEMLVSKKQGLVYFLITDENSNRYAFSKALSESRAIYKQFGVPGFIGLGLVDSKAFIYKKGTVEVWGTEEEVDFDKPEHKLEDSAKGEFIILAEDLNFVLDDETLELKADGNLYLDNVQKYTHVENVVDPTRALSKMHAVYKKGDSEFMGLALLEEVAESGEYTPWFYRPNKGDTYWQNADAVDFDDIHKFSPLDDFITDAAGTYGIFEYRDSKLMFIEGVVLQEITGTIVNGGDTYTINSLKEAGKAIYNSADKFIGVGFEVEGANKKLILYKFERKTDWDNIDNVSFEADHKVTDEGFTVDLIKDTFTGDYVLGTDTYNFKEKANGSADLYIGDTLTYEHFQNVVDANIVSTTDVIYKMANDTKYAGVLFNTENNTIEYYLNARTDEWTSPGDVEFTPINKVLPVDSWDPLGKINLMDRPDAFWFSGVVDTSGNFYVAFKDETEGSVVRFDRLTQTWDTEFHIQNTLAGKDISANFMAIDSDDNMYWVYHLINVKGTSEYLGIQRYDADTESWANFAHDVDGNTKDSSTEFLMEATGDEAVWGTYPHIIIDKNNSDAKYIIHKVGNPETIDGNKGDRIAVRKYNEITFQWEVLGDNGDTFMIGAGMKRLAVASDGTLYAATANADWLGLTGAINVYKYNKAGDTWETVVSPTADETSHIDLKFDANDNLYLAYRGPDNLQVKVVKLNASETAWEEVGNNAPSADNSRGDFVTLGFYGDNTPIVGTFGDNPKRPAYVYKFENDEWETVGTTSQAANPVGHGGMAVDTANNSIYIFYADFSTAGDGGGLTVRRHIKP